MRFVVFRAKVFQSHMRVFLGSRQAGVTEKFLDRAQIGPALEQMCCE